MFRYPQLREGMAREQIESLRSRPRRVPNGGIEERNSVVSFLSYDSYNGVNLYRVYCDLSRGYSND